MIVDPTDESGVGAKVPGGRRKQREGVTRELDRSLQTFTTILDETATSLKQTLESNAKRDDFGCVHPRT